MCPRPLTRPSSRPTSLPLAAVILVAGFTAGLATPSFAGAAERTLGAPTGLTQAQPEATSEPGTPTAAPAPGVSFSSSMWKKGKYDVHGTYRVEQDDSGLWLNLGPDFATKKGPDLKVVLSPLADDKVTGKNALGAGSINLGPLSTLKGESRYRIPEGTDLRSVRSVLIHCEDKAILWAAAPLSEGEVLASGHEWTKKTNTISGRWEIAITESGRVLRLGSTFKTKKAPDLKIVLSPLTTRAAKNDNALSGGFVLSPLSSPKGAQEYAIPDSVDLSRYASVLIHCQQYTKLWGGVPLTGWGG